MLRALHSAVRPPRPDTHQSAFGNSQPRLCTTVCLDRTTEAAWKCLCHASYALPLEEVKPSAGSLSKRIFPIPNQIRSYHQLSHPLNLFLRKEPWARKGDWAVPIRRLQSTSLFCSSIFREVEQVDAPNCVIPLWKLQRNKANTMAAYGRHYSQSSNIPSRRLDGTCLSARLPFARLQIVLRIKFRHCDRRPLLYTALFPLIRFPPSRRGVVQPKFKEIHCQIPSFQKWPASKVRTQGVSWPALCTEWCLEWLSIIWKSPHISIFDVYGKQHWLRRETSHTLSTGILVTYLGGEMVTIKHLQFIEHL